MLWWFMLVVGYGYAVVAVVCVGWECLMYEIYYFIMLFILF